MWPMHAKRMHAVNDPISILAGIPSRYPFMYGLYLLSCTIAIQLLRRVWASMRDTCCCGKVQCTLFTFGCVALAVTATT